MAVAQLGASLALFGDARRSGAGLHGGSCACQESRRNTTGIVPTTAPSSATARQFLRSPQKADPMPSVVPELHHAPSRPIAPRPAGRARRTTPGCCLRRAHCKQVTPRSQLTVDGAALHWRLLEDEVTGEELIAQPIVVANSGTTPIQAVVTTVAAPAQPLPAGGDGFTISRAYYRIDGSEAILTEVHAERAFRRRAQGPRNSNSLGLARAGQRPTCPPVSQSTIRGWSPARIWRISAGWQRTDAAHLGVPRRPLHRGFRPRGGSAATSRSPMSCAP